MLQSNPIPVIVTAFMAVLNAVLICLQTFAVDLTAAQATAIMGVANAIGGFVAALWAQSRTTPWHPPEAGDDA